MPTPTTFPSFPSFPSLPAELRLKIWRQALSTPSVWTIVPGERLSLIPAGPASYLAGLACHESRQLLEASYGKPLQSPGGRGVCWINLENDIIHLGREHEHYWHQNPNYDAQKAMDALGAAELARFRHAVIRWSRFCGINSYLQKLEAACPGLRTVVVRHEGDRYFDGPLPTRRWW